MRMRQSIAGSKLPHSLRLADQHWPMWRKNQQRAQFMTSFIFQILNAANYCTTWAHIYMYTTQRTLLSTSPSKRHKSTGSLFVCLLAQQKFRGEVITYTHPSSLIWRGNMILKLVCCKKKCIHIHIRALLSSVWRSRNSRGCRSHPSSRARAITIATTTALNTTVA